MSYLDVLSESKDLVTPGMSACQGCGGELILRKVLQISGENTIIGIPPGCMAGAGVVGWNFSNGLKIPVHIPLLDNTASLLSGVTAMYQKMGREDVNIIGLAGDGATADCGFQSLSAAAERGEHMLYVCYDNEGYMNTGFQRSSTTFKGSQTSTTPVGKVKKGKKENRKNIPMIMAMHGAAYVATASPGHMKDMVEKIEKGIAASKHGFAYLHIISPCPTGWVSKPECGIELAKKAVKSNYFPLFEVEEGVWRRTVPNPKPIPVTDFIAGLRKFKHLGEDELAEIQEYVDKNNELLEKLTREVS
ncbi:pyruvate/2-oxoacid:ferredoxin oxidoreductase beta subunit [Lachnospiraceae bacterium PF1-21]|uniref:thiamine pyrophosphate-dependent enzyme n=1 Tax=Ohessyouella blattaphilus TaxID=2949333 RepID=UPI003E308873